MCKEIIPVQKRTLAVPPQALACISANTIPSSIKGQCLDYSDLNNKQTNKQSTLTDKDIFKSPFIGPKLVRYV